MLLELKNFLQKYKNYSLAIIYKFSYSLWFFFISLYYEAVNHVNCEGRAACLQSGASYIGLGRLASTTQLEFHESDFHLKYTETEPTAECPTAPSTTIIFRCPKRHDQVCLALSSSYFVLNINVAFFVSVYNIRFWHR